MTLVQRFGSALNPNIHFHMLFVDGVYLPVAEDRLAVTPSGHVRYALKTPYRDGTTQIVLEPLDLMARLAALVPRPRMHLSRYHGVFEPHSKLRAAVTPAHRGVGAARQVRRGSHGRGARAAGLQAAGLVGFNLAAATSARAPGPLCEWNRRGGGALRVLSVAQLPGRAGAVLPDAAVWGIGAAGTSDFPSRVRGDGAEGRQCSYAQDAHE